MKLTDPIGPISLSLPPVHPGVPWYAATGLWWGVLWVLVAAFFVLAFLRFVPLLGKAAAFGVVRWRVLPHEWLALRRMSAATGVPVAALLVSATAFERGVDEVGESKGVTRLRKRVFG